MVVKILILELFVFQMKVDVDQKYRKNLKLLTSNRSLRVAMNAANVDPNFLTISMNRKESVFFSDSLLQTGLTESFSLCWLWCQLSFLLFCEVSEVRAIVCKDRRNKNEANCPYEQGSTNINATSNIQRLRNRHRKTILLQYLALIHAARDDIPQNLE